MEGLGGLFEELFDEGGLDGEVVVLEVSWLGLGGGAGVGAEGEVLVGCVLSVRVDRGGKRPVELGCLGGPGLGFGEEAAEVLGVGDAFPMSGMVFSVRAKRSRIVLMIEVWSKTSWEKLRLPISGETTMAGTRTP